MVITFWDAVTVEDPREIAFLPTSWSEAHAADTGFKNLQEFMNKFFRKTDCPASVAVLLAVLTLSRCPIDRGASVLASRLAAMRHMPPNTTRRDT